MGILALNQHQILAFLLVFLRCFSFFFAWPLFGGVSVPTPLKLLFSLTVAMICFALIKPINYPLINHYNTLIGLSVKELIIGLSMGFLCHLLFYAVSVAGELASMGMGLSASQIFNPSFGFSQSSVNQLCFILVAFLFLAINGHHYFIQGIYESFNLIPLNRIYPELTKMSEFTMVGGMVLKVGLLLSAPVLVSILLVNFSLGIVGRAVPQINVLITSLPINALMGFFILLIILPFFLDSAKTEFFNFTEVLFGFLKVF